MNYLIAVLSNRIQAEEAYTTLEKEGIPTDKITILGQGYKSADEFGLIDPSQPAKRQIRQLSIWLAPFGFAAGYVFNLLTGIEIIGWAGAQGNHMIGGLFGAVAALMGAFFVGGGVGILSGGGEAVPYRNRLNAGKYLLVVQGSEELNDQARRILRQFEPENLQGYTEPTSS
ncbi:MAG: hypothetical protein BRC40_16965 [Cyanobacteria bacterium QH_8_48_120]|jgi:hypothetical protein|nr:MAG: hypothetical protein BRC34_07980 [Cyanobacteria bacterium QH_1_48_107]PSO55746.1 MAG: hypothetical protein BRC35_11175 [Cyanobacteria bacterium QH_10_48_56]PSO63575.1 MAG: hypothetical protein BRC39_04275 [Cyanobacteria bacterium QH_7_48_89]PSO64301.1 MAG: hypothetical protein BRC36_07020 [Cyanobacteria bacterium QH_2_48_84]PSO65876.1 MAG: hypothetical protein BRC38_07510 [Cyanobacteria bacterium QH_6_48_35]PSO68668.1 MAG: hypothetical protein BRC40_16965 [Cyanobacteria bacterium QH_8_